MWEWIVRGREGYPFGSGVAFAGSKPSCEARAAKFSGKGMPFKPSFGSWPIVGVGDWGRAVAITARRRVIMLFMFFNMYVREYTTKISYSHEQINKWWLTEVKKMLWLCDFRLSKSVVAVVEYNLIVEIQAR